jgi:multisubunit Na+/H+ antiporter MnhB subunit
MSPSTLRNICIVIALVLVIGLSSGGSALAGVVGLVLRVLLIAAFIYFGYTLWKQNRQRLAWLPERQRSLLYAIVALLAVLIVGSFFWTRWNLVTSVVFLGLVGGLGYLAWRILQDARRYY